MSDAITGTLGTEGKNADKALFIIKSAFAKVNHGFDETNLDTNTYYEVARAELHNVWAELLDDRTLIFNKELVELVRVDDKVIPLPEGERCYKYHKPTGYLQIDQAPVYTVDRGSFIYSTVAVDLWVTCLMNVNIQKIPDKYMNYAACRIALSLAKAMGEKESAKDIEAELKIAEEIRSPQIDTPLLKRETLGLWAK